MSGRKDGKSENVLWCSGNPPSSFLLTERSRTFGIRLKKFLYQATTPFHSIHFHILRILQTHQRPPTNKPTRYHCLPHSSFSYNIHTNQMSNNTTATTTPPQDFTCCITQDLMQDPVIAADGQSYERSAIEEWFYKGHSSSPMTGAPLSHKHLTPNCNLKSQIEAWKQQHKPQSTPQSTPQQQSTPPQPPQNDRWWCGVIWFIYVHHRPASVTSE